MSPSRQPLASARSATVVESKTLSATVGDKATADPLSSAVSDAPAAEIAAWAAARTFARSAASGVVTTVPPVVNDARSTVTEPERSAPDATAATVRLGFAMASVPTTSPSVAMEAPATSTVKVPLSRTTTDWSAVEDGMVAEREAVPFVTAKDAGTDFRTSVPDPAFVTEVPASTVTSVRSAVAPETTSQTVLPERVADLQFWTAVLPVTLIVPPEKET